MQESSAAFSGPDLKEKLLKPARDIRSILRWGYPKFATIRFVADHSQLSVEERHILTRVIMPPDKVVSRVRKKIACDSIRDRDLLLDGYNVLLSVDSLLKNEPMWFCDDGYIRDTRYYFSKARQAEDIEEALDSVLEFLSEARSKSVTFLLDAQISRSGELAGFIRRKLKEKGISGEARTSKTTDFDLKTEGGNPENNLVVATSDGIVIDSVLQVLDIPACLMEKMGIEPVRLY
ncbi:MAG: DUF434 domain-containing protein [Methanosarcina sp.]|uniref:DUF434 domain-containing protein n=1 Tax=Methanosarcina sp. TaxID=2213 RepID=UPI002625E717|nr:DUF434 domain-containing protein [Methanosarcina sp.]MDD3248332.1 DUF434 domain-containing protein [Methanosarcina sp.]MDD4248409.1 DUF434 domain-containing protein [Methanosarcina sp.]